MNSLQKRLKLSLGASLTLLMVLLGWLMITLAMQLTEEFTLSRLQHDGESLLAAIQFDEHGQATLHNERVSAIYQQPLSGHYYQIMSNHNEVLTSRSLWDTRLQFDLLESGESRYWRGDGPAEQQLLFWAASYTKQEQSITIVVAEDLSPLQRRLYQYSGGFIGLSLLILSSLLLLQQQIIRRSFSPLQQLSKELGQLERGEISQLTAAVPQEVRPLVIEVNRLLGIMSQRLERSRSAVGNLAHALKGPLHLLSQITDSDALKEQPQLSQSLRKQTDILRQLIEHELKRARLAGIGSAAQLFTPSEELPVLTELLKRIYQEKRLNISCHFPDGTLPALDRFDLLELLGNLMDNASKWAQHQVECRIEANDNICITIDDDGPGISNVQMEQLTQRGFRLDESRPGHGLGLAIVKEIVELYQGELQFSRSPTLGGLRVSLRFSAHPNA